MVAVLTMVATACGSRLTDEQRQLAMRGFGGGGAGGGGGEEFDADFDFDDLDGGDGLALDDATQVDGDPGAAAGGGDAGSGGGEGGGNGGGEGGSGGGGNGGGGGNDTRAAPPGGNGGATDTGVTEDKIVVANVSDVSGAVPGLFEDARLATQAYFAMFAASEGTIYGRQIEYLPLDSRLEERGNRNAYLQACEKAFAAVGSMSAFEQGAAPVIRDCEIPDLRTAAPTPEIMTLPTMYSSQPLSPTEKRAAEWRYWAEQHPDAVKKAGYVYIDAATTQGQARGDMKMTSSIGYDWIYEGRIDLTETNYASYVLEMKNAGVEFVFFMGAYQQAARLAQAMRQQDFWPEAYGLQSNAYTPDLIATGGQAVEGVHVAVPGQLLEEINRNEEMQRYAQWLQQVKPGARPTGLGMYAWASAKLFIDAAKKAGPELTREKLIAELKKVGEFDANGLTAPHHVGNRVPTTCVIIVEVSGGKFVRKEPSSGFRCNDLVSY